MCSTPTPIPMGGWGAQDAATLLNFCVYLPSTSTQHMAKEYICSLKLTSNNVLPWVHVVCKLMLDRVYACSRVKCGNTGNFIDGVFHESCSFVLWLIMRPIVVTMNILNMKC